MFYYENKEKGFTLVEILISMSIGLIIILALSSTFLLQSDAYDDQEQITEMVQTARAAIDMMTREIRMAGYDPTATMQRSDPTESDFVGIPYNNTQLRIVADLNGDAETDGSITDDDTNEDITYSYDATNFQIDRDTGAGGQPFAENIQSLTFSYLDSSGNATTTTSDIRQIEISITARTAKPDHNYLPNSGYRTYTLSSVIITPRNLAL